MGLLDTGAAISAMDENAFNMSNGQVKYAQRRKPISMNITAANGGRIMVTGLYQLPVQVNNKTVELDVFIVKGLSSKFILGMDFMKSANININVPTEKVTMDGEVIATGFYNDHETKCHSMNSSGLTGSCTSQQHIPAQSLAAIKIKINGIKGEEEVYITGKENPYNDIVIYDTVGRTNQNGVLKLFVGNKSAEDIKIGRGVELCTAIKTSKFEAPSINALKTEAKKSQKEWKPLQGDEARKFLEKIDLRCPAEYRTKYNQLFLKYHDVFSKNEYDLGWTDKVSHRIKLQHDRPIHTKQFKIPLPHQEIIQEFVEEMLDRKLIEVSRSRYNSPIFCVKKKNGSWRPVVDLRAINQATVEDFYSIRDIKSCIDEIGRENSTVFSSMDLSKGFFQQNLAEESRPYTSFTVPGLGSFQFTVSCFGSHGAPSSFSYLMTEVLRNLQHLISFIDDVLAHTRNHEKQILTLDTCFERLREYNLKLSLDKSTFGASETEYLGFKITDKGILPGTDKTKAVKEFQPPKTVKQIRQFVGLASFFRDHIKDFSRISGYLTALTRKTSEWKGGELPEQALTAFRRLQHLLVNEPVIAYARNDLPFKLYCDASMGTVERNGHKISGGLGAVLTQVHEDGKERVVGYASRKLKTHEENYPAYLLELLAVTFGCEHYHHYLYGQKKFIVYSDHRPLSKLNKVHTKTQGRLREMLLEYNYEIVYRPGEDQEAADFLSRNALDEIQTEDAKERNLDFEDYSKTEILEHQNNDNMCRDIQKFMKGETSEMDGVKIGILRRYEGTFSQDEDGILWKQEEGRSKLLIAPRKFSNQIIKQAHDSPVGGHRDLEKTMERIKRVYWWLTLRRDIGEYIRSCHNCQQLRGPKSSNDLKCPLQPLRIPEKFNERVHADLMGPLRSITSNRYILVMSDAFTKWIELVPLPNKSAEEVGKAIYENWICRNSPMDVLITDNGKEFRNQIMEELCQNNGIKHRYTSPYHPQTNAQCERQNRTILSYLKTFVDESTLNWEDKLAPCQYSYNTQVHQSTRTSPYFARHFQSPTIPFKRLNTPAPKYSESWPNEALLTQQEVWKNIHDNLSKAADTQRTQYDKNVTERKFEAGDLVCIIDDKPKLGKNVKLVKRWTGPFVLIKIISDTNAIIKRKPKGKEEIVHLQRLKKYHTLPTDYETGYLNRKMEENNTSQTVQEERPPPPSTAMPSSIPTQAGGLPPIPEDNEEDDDEDSDDDNGGDKLVHQEETDKLRNTILTGRRSTTSDVWREGIDFASTPMNNTMADNVFEDQDEEKNDRRRKTKRTADPEATKPNWGTKRRVCEGCLTDQVFSDSESELEEPEKDEANPEEDGNENPWITVQRRRKPSQDLSEEPSFKRGHFRGHKHPREPNVSKEEIEFKRTYRDAEETEAQGTDDAPVTRQTRSQGLAPEHMLPTRPLEYKKYTKRK